MPVPAVIAAAAENFRFNNGFLVKSVSELSDEEWLRQPGPNSNHIAWIVGHIIYCRNVVLSPLGQEWSRPWLSKFSRGVQLEEAAPYPSPQELMEAWHEVSTLLATTLQNATQETMDQPAPKPGPPSADGKMSGMVNFMAMHETYHGGQIGYLCTWLGHKGPLG